jgi:hypothetical protein
MNIQFSLRFLGIISRILRLEVSLPGFLLKSVLYGYVT